MSRAFISLGSNINPRENIAQAIHLLNSETRVLGISTVYETEPVGRPDQPLYCNCIVEIATDMAPLELKQRVLQRIEEELGRIRSEDACASRTIDLDLILYDTLVVKNGDLTLPDPDILQRPFLAIPLLELSPGLRLPGTDAPIDRIAATMPRNTMKPLAGYTKRIREEIFHDGTQ
jgi:2-amino-4-hydroxy-6-hydroxymethyldihydropteridine diphosphokinase